MSRAGILAYVIAVIAMTLIAARETFEPIDYLVEERGGTMPALTVAAWFAATFGPLSLSVFIWTCVNRLNWSWLGHLLFIPVCIVLFRESVATSLSAVGVRGGSMVHDMPFFLGAMYLVLTLAIHATALIVKASRAIARR